MLHQFIGADRRADFDRAVQRAGKTLSTGAALFALRVPMERLYTLLADDSLDAWAFCPEQGMMATHYMVSSVSVVTWGIRGGVFRAAADAQHLVSTAEVEALAETPQNPR